MTVTSQHQSRPRGTLPPTGDTKYSTQCIETSSLFSKMAMQLRYAKYLSISIKGGCSNNALVCPFLSLAVRQKRPNRDVIIGDRQRFPRGHFALAVPFSHSPRESTVRLGAYRVAGTLERVHQHRAWAAQRCRSSSVPTAGLQRRTSQPIVSGSCGRLQAWRLDDRPSPRYYLAFKQSAKFDRRPQPRYQLLCQPF